MHIYVYIYTLYYIAERTFNSNCDSFSHSRLFLFSVCAKIYLELFMQKATPQRGEEAPQSK